MDTRGEVKKITVDESEDGCTFTTTIIYSKDDELTSEEMADIQGELNQMVKAPALG